MRETNLALKSVGVNWEAILLLHCGPGPAVNTASEPSQRMSLLAQAYGDVAEASIILPYFFLLFVIFSNNKKLLKKVFFLFRSLGIW